MPPKPSDPGWKTGEQLEFLLSNWSDFKRCQDNKSLDRFWQRVTEQWYTRWPVPPASPTSSRQHGGPEAARHMLQKSKTTVCVDLIPRPHHSANSISGQQIKNWFNNRCRGSDSMKQGRADLKLDLNDKRKLAPLQAYCSYYWSTLQPLVQTRWEQQKSSTTFEDNEDPSEDVDVSSEDACIPLSFKLLVAKEYFDNLTKAQKTEINRRRDEDREKLYRTIPEIDNTEERIAKLQTHQRCCSLDHYTMKSI